MAARPFVTVTLPDGRIAKRQSARPYAFVVAAAPRDAETVADEFIRKAQEREVRAQVLREAAVAPFTLKSRGLGSSRIASLQGKAEEGHYSHEARLGTSDVAVHAGPAGLTKTLDEAGEWIAVPAEPYLRERALRMADEAEAVARNYRDQADHAKADEAWTVVRWTSRLELAQRETADDGHFKTVGHRLEILPVD